MLAESRFMGVFWLLLGIAICAGSATFPFGNKSDPGPGYLPFACGIVIAVIGAVMAFNARAASGPRAEEGRRLYSDRAAGMNVALALIAMSLCAALMNILGFTLSAFLLIAFLMRVVGNINWKAAFLYATVYSLGSFVMFALLLKTQLPRGMIWSWL